MLFNRLFSICSWERDTALCPLPWPTNKVLTSAVMALGPSPFLLSALATQVTSAPHTTAHTAPSSTHARLPQSALRTTGRTASLTCLPDASAVSDLPRSKLNSVSSHQAAHAPISVDVTPIHPSQNPERHPMYASTQPLPGPISSTF